MTNIRSVAAIALASGTFGGAIGALATAATQSQASPAAIAAAVQRVSDQAAERSLRTISGELGTLHADLQVLDRPFGGNSIGTILDNIENQLFDICLNTDGATSHPALCATPNPPAARDR